MSRSAWLHGLSVLLLSWVLVSCGSSKRTPGIEIEKIKPSGTDHIFDQEALHTFELSLPEASLAAIDADPTAEEYVEGSLTFEGETISPVDIRYKGSVGAFLGCTSNQKDHPENWANPKGHKTCTKLSIRVKVKGRKFYGLKNLQFHSMNQDPTQMRDRLGYWLFREMGVAAPRSVHARLVINGTYSGVYVLIEKVDGRFTKRNFADGKGNLYKGKWPVDMHGQPLPVETHVEALKTNEDEDHSALLIQTFAQEIAASDSGDSLREVLSRRMDIEKTMAFVAVDRAIRADDGPFHWYCSKGICGNHNYYWYEEPTEGRLHLVPWDLDHAFQNIVVDVNPVTAIADGWGEITAGCEPFTYGPLEMSQRSAACDTLTAGWVSFGPEHKQALAQLLQGPLSESRMDPLLDAWVEQIRPATADASQDHADALSVTQWEEALASLRADLAVARRKLAVQIQN